MSLFRMFSLVLIIHLHSATANRPSQEVELQMSYSFLPLIYKQGHTFSEQDDDFVLICGCDCASETDIPFLFLPQVRRTGSKRWSAPGSACAFNVQQLVRGISKMIIAPDVPRNGVFERTITDAQKVYNLMRRRSRIYKLFSLIGTFSGLVHYEWHMYFFFTMNSTKMRE